MCRLQAIATPRNWARIVSDDDLGALRLEIETERALKAGAVRGVI